MSKRSDKSPSVPSGTRYATKDTHLPLRTAASVEDIMKLPVAFDIVTPSNSEFGPTSPAPSCSFTAYDQMMKNGDQAKGTTRTADSVAELQAFPSISSTKERDARTVNKRLHTVESREELRKLPELPPAGSTACSSGTNLTLKNSDYAYGPPPPAASSGPTSLCNSDYAYYPPVLRNSDYAYSYDKANSTGLTPTNSSYCYVNADGTSRLASSYPAPRQARNLPNPYAAVSRYQMEDSAPTASNISFVDTERIPSNIYLVGYERELPPPRAPNAQTLNKNVRGTVTVEDLTRVEVTFMERGVGSGSDACCPLGAEMSTSNSLGRQVIRDFCRDSLAELSMLPSLSSYNFDQPEPDVQTALSIRSPCAEQTADVKTAQCLCTPPKRTTSRVSTARSFRSEDDLKYFPEAVDPCSRSRRQ